MPGLLGKYFERLRKAAQAAEAVAQAQQDGAAQAQTDSKDSTSGAWLTTFRKDMQSLLLAELDVRFQPVEGLLAALRTR